MITKIKNLCQGKDNFNFRKFKRESLLNNKSRGIAPNVTELEKEKYSVKMKSMAKNLSDMDIMLNQNSTNNSKLLRDSN